MPKFKVTVNWGKPVILKTNGASLVAVFLVLLYRKRFQAFYEVGDSDIITVERVE